MAESEQPVERGDKAEQPASSRSPESYERLASPALRVAWLMRTSAIVGVAASVVGALVVPGLRGLASDAAITRWEHISAALAYAFGFLLAGLLLTGAFDLSRTRKVNIASRMLLFTGAPGVLAMLVPAFARALTPVGSLVLIIATLLTVIGGASAGLRTAHTRALSVVQLVFAFSALVRMIAWVLSTIFSDSLRIYSIARTFNVTGILAEGVAQALIVAWLSTRRRSSSLATMSALLLAGTVVWLASHADASSPAWQCVLRSGISGQTTGTMTLGVMEAFFVTASVVLALACSLLGGQITVVMCAFALALLGRGAFDVPLRALAASAAAIWTTLAAVDDRAMWKSLVVSREADTKD